MMPIADRHQLPAVDDYIAHARPFAQEILHTLREVVHEGAPGVEEAMKWSRPFFVYRGVILANLAAFGHHCSLGLWGSETAAELREEGVVADGAMGSFGRITSLADLPARGKLVAYVRSAAKLIDDGVRTKSVARTPQRVAKPPASVPEALASALETNAVAAAKFAAMSASCRREYCDWVGSAKRQDTQRRRVQEALGMIAEGKSRHWKYEAR